MSRTSRLTPVELVPPPWPEVEGADPLGEIGRLFAVALREAIGSQSVRSVADRAGLSHVTLLNVLAGRAWPDLATIGRLELTLQVDLVPRRRGRQRKSSDGKATTDAQRHASTELSP